MDKFSNTEFRLKFELLNDNTYSVVGYDGTPINLAIPSSYNDLPVTNVGGSAFFGCNSLISVIIPDSVTSIDYCAFATCSALNSVTIGRGVKEISDNAFFNCNALARVDINSIESWCGITFTDHNANPLYYAKNLYLNGELVKELVIPDAVTKINDYAFNNCNSLTRLIINDSVISIGSYAFHNCALLSDLTLGNSLINISDYAFGSCDLLTHVTIPKTASYVSKKAFQHCNSLTSVTISNN